MHKTAQNEAWLSGLEAWSMTWKGQLVRALLLLSFAPVLGNFEELWPRTNKRMPVPFPSSQTSLLVCPASNRLHEDWTM